MQLVVNEQQQIIAYSVLGNISGSVAYNGAVPEDFAINFVPNLYLLKSNTIVTNPDYVAPIASPERPTPPTETDKLKLMVGNLVAENAKKDQSIKQLQEMTGTLVAQIAELNKGGK